MKEAIKDITIKDKQGSKISKFVLQMYVFVYQRIMDFPQGCFDHQFFSKRWLTLSQSQKTELMKIIVSGKDVIPYEKTDSIDALQKRLDFFFQKKNYLAH